jgi:hypothetical protein
MSQMSQMSQMFAAAACLFTSLVVILFGTIAHADDFITCEIFFPKV